MRGITKSIQRAPQQVRNIINKNNQERDLDFKALEDHVNKIQTQVKNLLTDSDKFKKTVENMLKHQEELGKTFLELYKPMSSFESSMSLAEEDRRSSVYSTQSVEVVNGDTKKIDIYLEKSKLMNDQIIPQLQNINFHVVEPMKAYQDIIHSVKLVLKKRSHKALDYDRHKESLEKLGNKQSRSLDEERKLNKTREAFNTAEMEFRTYDEQLKQQLPVFFDCSSNLYDSCLITFYSIQKDIYHVLYVYFYEIATQCGLDLNSDIVKQYESHNCQAILDEQKVDSLNRLLTAGHLGLSTSTSVYSTTGPMSPTSPTGSNFTSTDNSRRPSQFQDDLPSYESAVNTRSTYNPTSTFNSSSTYSSARPSISSTTTPSRLPPAIPKKPSIQYVTALYDFTAQNAGDISFKRGDKIEIVKKTDNANEWWTGRINGQVGQFPGNYVQ